MRYIKNKLPLKLSLLALISLHCGFAHSEANEAHVHGVSDLTIVVDKNLIEINLVSPTLNLVGFEGRAENKEQLKAVEHARKQLGQYNKLFSFIDTRCVMAKSSLNIPDLSPEEPSDHHHGHSHGHNHGHSHDHMLGRQHTDITAMYQYRCQNIDKLSAISIGLFDMFPATEKINAQWIHKNKQGASTLNKQNKTVTF